ncbi:MAG TPA: FAD-binding oxidoreductase [Chroococcidiopsis sp.]
MEVAQQNDKQRDIATHLERIVGSDGFCHWQALDATDQAALIQATQSDQPVMGVVYPQHQDALSQVMACCHHHGWRVLTLGHGSKLSWGGLVSADIAVSTSRMNRLIDHAVGDLTVTLEAGIGFAALQASLAAERQFLAIDPAYPDRATLGGIVATADTGRLRQRYGGIRDMLIGLSLVRADGQIAKAGGRVVKNVAGYDLMKLLSGSYGTLGIISQLTFRVYPLPPASQTVLLSGPTEAIAQVTRGLLASALTPTAVELICPKTLARLGLKVGFTDHLGLLTQFQSLEVSVTQQAERLMQIGQAADLEAIAFAGVHETNLWQQLQEPMAIAPQAPVVRCKIGVLPADAAIALQHLTTHAPAVQSGQIHASSGLGWLQLDGAIAPDQLHTLREYCQNQGGFLSLLEGPAALKQQIDVWGYQGNALGRMRQIKQQFDPKALLNPGRFVGGI